MISSPAPPQFGPMETSSWRPRVVGVEDMVEVMVTLVVEDPPAPPALNIMEAQMVKTARAAQAVMGPSKTSPASISTTSGSALERAASSTLADEEGESSSMEPHHLACTRVRARAMEEEGRACMTLTVTTLALGFLGLSSSRSVPATETL